MNGAGHDAAVGGINRALASPAWSPGRARTNGAAGGDHMGADRRALESAVFPDSRAAPPLANLV